MEDKTYCRSIIEMIDQTELDRLKAEMDAAFAAADAAAVAAYAARKAVRGEK